MAGRKVMCEGTQYTGPWYHQVADRKNWGKSSGLGPFDGHLLSSIP